jgi:hypothetical protein
MKDKQVLVTPSPAELVQLRRRGAGRVIIPPDHGLGAAAQGSRPAPLPAPLRAAVEQMSGLALGDVRVHYNSARPAQLNALAHAQGADIHLAPGQEQHLPHEAWHVVQQAQGRVKPTLKTVTGVALNDDPALEREADVMGAKASAGQSPQGALGEAQAMAAPRWASDLAVQAKGIGLAREDVYRDPRAAWTELVNPTWDPNVAVSVADKVEKGGWVEATAVRGAPGMLTNIGTAETPNRVDKRMVSGTTVDRRLENPRLWSPEVTEDDLQSVTTAQAAQVNPMGRAPRNILKHALHESWHHAKELLLAPEPEISKPGRELLMTKLWEFRQWHHDLILRRTQAHPDIGREGLTEWKAAGSTTLTSDIDVNLKGNKTELAVAVFNRLFKADGWAHEAGVVYDVNVYAMDFMHKDTFKGLAEQRGKVVEHKFEPGGFQPTRVSAKEGKRTGSVGGGIGTQNAMLGKRMLDADADLQRVWSLVKMRLYMTGTQWAKHVRDAEVPRSTASAVDLRYRSYMRDLHAKMIEGQRAVEWANETRHTGFAVLASIATAVGRRNGTDPEEVKMAASNRLYEARLIEMAALRATVQRQIARRQRLLNAFEAGDAEGLDAAIDGNLAILRDLISECAMFSNEAYVTDGAINHTVVGLQSKIGISQTRTETLDAFNENVADSLKEIARHSRTIGEAAYKAGKYLWRMADAAKNLGSRDADIGRLYQAGFTIANEIKGGDRAQAELERLAGAELVRCLGKRGATPDALMAFVRELAARMALAYAAQIGVNRRTRTAPVDATR